MDAVEAARNSAEAIGMLPAGYMLDGVTYERGGALGFEGVDFYVAGRGGALGDVDGTVVAAAFVFFNPETIVEGWERGRKVMSPDRAAAEFAAVAAAWAQAHLGDGPDYARLAALAGRVVEHASPAGAPLFAAWAALDAPDGPKALALHRLNLLRELRGALHGASVLGHGLEPLQAVMVKTPFMATLFGWAEPYPDTGPCAEAWERAEAATDRAMARAFDALDGEELAEFVELASAAYQGAA